jgi:hypothetical protein
VVIIVDVKSGGSSPWHRLQVAAYWLAWKEGNTDGITFDAEKHKYSYNGVDVPGVSTILRETKRQPSYDGFNPFYAQKGSYVHRAIELEVAGKLDEATVDERVKPYLVAWRKFKADVVTEVHATEQMVYHPGHNYAGTFDLLITIPGESEGMAVLYLGKDEKYKWRPLTKEKAIDAGAGWLKALTEYHAAKDDLWA